ncbi:MAG: BspA family leucine-rich repeat surface protein [Marinifilaceae bacterium]|jgi:surface protein|nr:BspA family leucine-rich repeat surface protein [Marinifilaceae bacterium]
MNNKLRYCFLYISLIILYISCEKDIFKTYLSSEAEIHSFLVDSYESEIKNDSIELKVSYGTNIKKMHPIINISKDAEVIPKSGVVQDFSFPVKYEVIAEDGFTREYTVYVSILPNTESKIKFFVVDFKKANIQDNNISLVLDQGYKLGNIKPIIEISANASVKPKSGVSVDFNTPQKYTVTAEDGSKTIYTVLISNTGKVGTDIYSFKILGYEGEILGSKIYLELPYATDLTQLVPEIHISEKARISPKMGLAQDFTNPVFYTVSAQYGLKTNYEVCVVKSKNTEAQISAFIINDKHANIKGQNISLELAYDVDISNLTPEIKISDAAEIYPKSGVAQDFTNEQKYIVVAEDGFRNEFIVKIVNEANTKSRINMFEINNKKALIFGTEISLQLAYGTDLSNLVPEIEISTGASIQPEAQTDFSKEVVYTVTAEDGSTTDYTVEVSCLPNNEARITSFKIGGKTADISESDHNISMVLDYGLSLEDLSPEIEISDGASIYPSSGVSRDFSGELTYVVIAGDGSVVNYTVNITNKPNTESSIISFSIGGKSAEIIESTQTINLTVPYESELENLVPIIEISGGAKITPKSGELQDFSNTVIYTVTAEDGSKSSYKINVEREKNDEALILNFRIGSKEIEVSPKDEKIVMHVDSKVELENLPAFLRLSEGATVLPESGSSQDFSKIVEYVVSSSAGNKNIYEVELIKGKNSACLIESFIINGIEGIIKEDKINLELAYGTDLKKLIPIIKISDGASIAPTGEVDFTNEIVYKVTAEDGSEKSYTVKVVSKKNSESKIKSFKVGNKTAVINGTEISLQLAYGTDLSNLVPEIGISTGASIQPEAQTDFSEEVVYTVTAEDGSIAYFIVKIELEDCIEYAENGVSICIRDDYFDVLKIGQIVKFKEKEYTIASKDMIEACLKEGREADLEFYITSKITNMSGLFRAVEKFSKDISHWDVSNVKDMSYMFQEVRDFNGDISKWDVSNVLDMSFLFSYSSSSEFNVEDWNVSKVRNMKFMFAELYKFNSDISNWDVSNVHEMQGMFKLAEAFNQNIGGWNVSNVRDMDLMFRGASSFNQNISKWDVSSVETMFCMFYKATSFNQEILNWDVSNVLYFEGMFCGATSFNSNIGSWDVSKAKWMDKMFYGATSFNQDIGGWNTANVREMKEMFFGASNFNQNLSTWDVERVESFDNAFSGCPIENDSSKLPNFTK